MSAVYVTAEKLRRATAILEMHLESDRGGRCLGCGEMEPCRGRDAAHEWFAVLGALPQRRRNRLAEGDGWFGFGRR